MLLKNVNLIGFKKTSFQDGMDISIDKSGTVDNVGFNLSSDGHETVLDLKGYLLSPGWIDMHAHVYEGGTCCGVNPDRIGVLAGVTTVVDAGSAGWDNFQALRDFIIKRYKHTRVVPFINISSFGLILEDRVSEFDSLQKIQPDRIYGCIQENSKYIKGLKIRASGGVLRGWESEAVNLACKAAREADLPLMVHIGEPLPLLEDILPKLRKGDIVTHCYHGKRWGLIYKGLVIPEAIKARELGVKFDVGHGYGYFDMHVAKEAIAQGFKPDIISSDLNEKSLNSRCHSLALTMSKFLSLGLSLDEVICDVTLNPAQLIGLDNFQDGVTGKKARFTVFKLENKTLSVEDSSGNRWDINSVIQPAYTIVANECIKVATYLKAEM